MSGHKKGGKGELLDPQEGSTNEWRMDKMWESIRDMEKSIHSGSNIGGG